MRDRRSTPDGPDPGQQTPRGSDPSPDPEAPLRDPAHRAARWFMILAPVLLVVAVFLLLRLSTG